MGYPMTWARLVRRNNLVGDYTTPCPTSGHTIDSIQSAVRGDMRRLELDTCDEQHLKMYAEKSGATTEQVKKIFETFFDDTCGTPFRRW